MVDSCINDSSSKDTNHKQNVAILYDEESK